MAPRPHMQLTLFKGYRGGRMTPPLGHAPIPAPAPPPTPEPKYEELPMLLSAREIRKKYAPAEGDIEPQQWVRTSAGDQIPETTEQFWQRKAREAEDPSWGAPEFETASGRVTSSPFTENRVHTGEHLTGYDRYGRYFSGPAPRSAVVASPNMPIEPDESLAESVRRKGIEKPVWLQAASREDIRESRNAARAGQGRGPSSSARPQVLGGHHRLAAAQFGDPDRLIPVLYETDIMKAKIGYHSDAPQEIRDAFGVSTRYGYPYS